MKRLESTHLCLAGDNCSHDVRCVRCGADAECSIEFAGLTEPYCDECVEAIRPSAVLAKYFGQKLRIVA